MDCCEHKMKHTPRSDEDIKALKSRINRIIGQLNGIAKMIEENRYCRDVLTQIAATEKALEAVGLNVLSAHMNGCVKDDILNGNFETIDETVELIRKLK